MGAGCARNIMMKKKLIFLPAVMVVLAGCTQNVTPGTPTETPATGSDQIQMETAPVEMEDSTNVPIEDDMIDSDSSMIDLSMGNFAYSVKEIQASAGETITIRLTNEDGMHDFMIDELKVKSKQLSAGQTQDIEIKIPADAKGKTYEYYCSVGNHRQMGMSGKLVIN